MGRWWCDFEMVPAVRVRVRVRRLCGMWDHRRSTHRGSRGHKRPEQGGTVIVTGIFTGLVVVLLMFKSLCSSHGHRLSMDSGIGSDMDGYVAVSGTRVIMGIVACTANSLTLTVTLALMMGILALRAKGQIKVRIRRGCLISNGEHPVVGVRVN